MAQDELSAALQKIQDTEVCHKTLMVRIALDMNFEGGSGLRGLARAVMEATAINTMERFSSEDISRVIMNTVLTPHAVQQYCEDYPFETAYLLDYVEPKNDARPYKSKIRGEAKVILWIEMLKILLDAGVGKIFGVLSA